MSDLRACKTLAAGNRAAPDEWRRWRMEELPVEPAAAPDVTAESRAPSTSELQECAAEARERGFAEGRQSGHEEGYRAGYETGLAEGRAVAETELEKRSREALRPLQTLVRNLEEACTRIDEEVADSIVELALSVGRQLARDALDERPETILNIVRELLHNEPALSGKPRLWLHPDDLALVEKHLGHETDASGWQLQPDDTLQRGGCRLNSSSGEIDATWDERVASISRQVRRSRRRRRQSAANQGGQRS